jgi:hypothetical protein
MPEHLRIDRDPSYWRNPEALAMLAARPQTTTIDMRYLPMGGSDLERPGSIILRLPPGYVIPRHAHPCERLEMIVAGSLDVGDDILVPGDVMIAHAGEMYGPHFAGPEGVTTIEVFEHMDDSWHTIFATPDGPVQIDALAGDLRPHNAILTR